MKKLFALLFASVVFFATSCTERTCPTYSKVPVDQSEMVLEEASV